MGLDAVDLFRRMPHHLVDEFTYVVVLNACSHSGLINEARSIFQQIQLKTTKIYTAMVNTSIEAKLCHSCSSNVARSTVCLVSSYLTKLNRSLTSSKDPIHRMSSCTVSRTATDFEDEIHIRCLFQWLFYRVLVINKILVWPRIFSNKSKRSSLVIVT